MKLVKMTIAALLLALVMLWIGACLILAAICTPFLVVFTALWAMIPGTKSTAPSPWPLLAAGLFQAIALGAVVLTIGRRRQV